MRILQFLLLGVAALGVVAAIAAMAPNDDPFYVPPQKGKTYLTAYQRCVVDSMYDAARRFEKQDRTYYTITAAQVEAMARRNAELECADK